MKRSGGHETCLLWDGLVLHQTTEGRSLLIFAVKCEKETGRNRLVESVDVRVCCELFRVRRLMNPDLDQFTVTV